MSRSAHGPPCRHLLTPHRERERKVGDRHTERETDVRTHLETSRHTSIARPGVPSVHVHVGGGTERGGADALGTGKSSVDTPLPKRRLTCLPFPPTKAHGRAGGTALGGETA
jgi:hypothetical protein